jgi:hypothetical protein
MIAQAHPYIFVLIKQVFDTPMMTAIEAARFEKDPLFGTSLIMRKWDDLAKEVNMPVLDFTVLREKVVNVLGRRVAS